MNQAELASTLLDLKGRTPNVALVRDILKEDYGQALELGWIVPDYDNGGILITGDASRIEAMRAAAATLNRQAQPEFVCNESIHAFVPMPPAQQIVICEVAVGDSVSVADAGKVFDGVVQSVNADGTYEVSFGADKPAKSSFRTEELRLTKKSDKPALAPEQVTPIGGAKVPTPGVG